MDDTTKRTNSSEHTVPHAPWQLEKDTEGLDKGSQASSPSKEETDEEKSSTEGCGCKYF